MIKQIKENMKRLLSSKQTREIMPEKLTYEQAMEIRRNNSKVQLVDVRSPQEYKEGHIAGVINIPLYELEDKMQKLGSKEDSYIFYCSTGHRSSQAVELLKNKGYFSVSYIKGEIGQM